jgi:CheY-like chemotaxis protein
MRILVVDDEPSILEVLKAFLEAGGAHQVVTATSGIEALALIEEAEHDFDCMLLDIQMPVMNGIALCENIRALPGYFSVPIIMLTAMSQKPYIDNAFAVGATDYVTKPFDFLELRGRLTSAAKIIEEVHRASDSTEQARRTLQDAKEETKPHPDEPLSIEGVERVVGYTALENYLFTLSRTKLFFASTYAIVIDDFTALHEAVSAKEMRGILRTVARMAVNGAPSGANIVSYRGNGVFLCVNQKKSAITPRQRAAQINSELAQNESLTPDKKPIRISAGQEISLLSFSRAGALVALRRAIDTVEPAPVANKDLITMSKRALRSNSQSQEQSNLERRAYEIALEEIIREEDKRAV